MRRSLQLAMVTMTTVDNSFPSVTVPASSAARSTGDSPEVSVVNVMVDVTP